MDTKSDLEQKNWWEYIGSDLQNLLIASQSLINWVESWELDNSGKKPEFYDYSFIVFPAAKAYEGFLKKIFLDLGFITQEDYFGKHFRIGRSLNPSLPKDVRRVEVYEKIVNHCGGHELADNLWETWSVCRNLTFHWFPDEKNSITLTEAITRVNMILNAFDAATEKCKINYAQESK
jgi:hypothetical protein